MDELPEHLGGGERRCHNDRGALRFAIKNWDVKSMLDIGCGRACVVKDAIDIHKMDALGIDGDPGTLHGEFNFERPDVPFMLHDYTEGPAPLDDREFDLCWTVEFLEHVDEKYMGNWMEDVRRCKYVICTHAEPGDGGRHHVNEQYMEYWINKFDQFGFDFDVDLTNELREASTMTKRFMRENGLVFIRRG
jgi:hypothetical protein